MTRRILLILWTAGVAVFAQAPAAQAPAAQQDLPKAETILDRYIQATGGKANYEKRKSRVMTGTLEFVAMGVKGSITSYSAEPDQAYSVVELEGIGKIESGVSNGVAWEISPMMGPRVKDGVEKADTLRDATFNGLLHWRKLYQKAETAGVEPVDGDECYKIAMTPNEGKTENLFFSKKSGLMVKRSRTMVSPMGEIPVEELAANYKDFGGILIPTTITQKAASQEFKITIQTIKEDGIPPERFAPPAQIKALLEKSK